MFAKFWNIANSKNNLDATFGSLFQKDNPERGHIAVLYHRGPRPPGRSPVPGHFRTGLLKWQVSMGAAPFM